MKNLKFLNILFFLVYATTFFADGEGEGGGSNEPENKTEDQKKEEEPKMDYKEAFKDLQSQLEKVKAKNAELIAEKRKVQEAKKKAEEEAFEKKKKEAEMSDSDKKKLEIAQMELDKLKKQLEEKEAKEAELAQKQLQDSIKKTFKSAMGNVEFFDEDLAIKALDTSKFILEDSGKFNEDGVKQAVEEFRSKYSFMVKPSDKDLKQEAGKGKSKKELSKFERYKKYLMDAE